MNPETFTPNWSELSPDFSVYILSLFSWEVDTGCAALSRWLTSQPSATPHRAEPRISAITGDNDTHWTAGGLSPPPSVDENRVSL